MATDKVRIILNLWVAFMLLIGGTTFVLLQRARHEKVRKSILDRQLAHFAKLNKKYEAEYAERKRLEREKKEEETLKVKKSDSDKKNV